VRVLRIGIIGAGIMGRWHSRVYQSHEQCQVVGVCDLDKSRARALADEFDVTEVYGSHEEMISGANMDMVSVCTPDFAHAAPTIDCVSAGIHVLVEKPLAVRVEDAEAIIAAAQKNAVKVMAQFSHRWVPSYRQAKDLLSGGELGEPLLAYARKNDHIYVPTEMLKWADRSTPAWFLSSHDIDLVCWYFDLEPQQVYASAVRKVLVDRGVDTPDAIQAQVRFAGGAVATFEACWTYPNTFPTMTDSFMEIITTGAVIHLDRKREQIEVSTVEGFHYPRNLLGYVYDEGEMHGAVPLAVHHFIRCVLEDREPMVTLQSSLRVTRILDAIQRSIDLDAPVALDS
jgi:predicted dehydrogenase